ncbi:DUF2189 domain-containing protein [Altererythrobacter lutimaris]|uniref:DUF2189 domain-containing protein n=1 Tax=Altererythrobacter lutimaris TaxID=2743979 RepID=A0A850H573_9SPHN|nr:DUF2189 domain-containing protein [Altererythrobacter lutimaris]NVE94307.1 DUF2189 domain-containing protein [Altererythrobacter lutimaris]
MAGQTVIANAAVANDLSLADLRAALAAGWADFRAEPIYGIFFAAIYVAGGFLMYFALMRMSSAAWLIPAAAGFPLLAPFTAVGLYEVSRRRESGEPISWKPVLGALRGHGDEQIISMGVIVFVAFAFWLIVAHSVFAVFAAEFGAGAESLAFLMTQTGLIMLAVGSVIGAIMALVFYAFTVISLPMLVDREVDFLTAIIASLATIRSNTRLMLIWACLIAILLGLALLPLFLGLFLALPVLGHATWHLYRRAVVSNGEAA